MHLANVAWAMQRDGILGRVYFMSQCVFLEAVAGGALSLPGFNQPAKVVFSSSAYLNLRDDWLHLPATDAFLSILHFGLWMKTISGLRLMLIVYRSC